MNEKHINRAIGIWLAFPDAPAGTLSGVVSYSSPKDGVRFESYTQLMKLLRRLSAATPAGSETPAILKLAS